MSLTDFKLTAADWIKIVLLAVALSAGWYRMDDRLQANEEVLNDVRSQTTRMEHYLQSRDATYWKTVHENGDVR